MKKRFSHSLLIVLLVGTQGLYAQQPSLASLYNVNPYIVNPAYAGQDTTLNVSGWFRKQWTGLKGTPTTALLSADMPLFALRSGIGLQIDNDIIGAQRQTGVKLSWMYRAISDKKVNVSVAASAGLRQLSLNGAILQTPDGDYDGGVVIHNDNTLPAGRESGMVPLFDLGVLLQAGRLGGGFALHNAIPVQGTVGNARFLINRQWIAHVDYRWQPSRDIGIRPSVLLRSDEIKIQTDFSLCLDYKNNIFALLSWRGYSDDTAEGLILGAGAKLSSNMFLMYSYDLSLSGLRNVNGGSHEVILKYQLGKRIGRGVYPPVRFIPRLL